MNAMLDEKRIQSTVILHIAPITSGQLSGLAFAIPPSIAVLQRLGVQTGLLTTSARGAYTQAESYPVIYRRNLPYYPAIASLPKPLNQPDLIVFHSTYIPAHSILAYEAIQRKIPYVITPHGGMTQGAQQQKSLKKQVGNFLFFNWMVRNATALHCLNKAEGSDVQKICKRPVFIVGNGVDLPGSKLLAYPGSKPELKFVFLGRLDIHHKGLDFLLEACAIIQESLRKSQVQILLYGSDIAGSKYKLETLINSYQIQDLIHLKEPVRGEAKQAVFQNADLFLHTSRFEGHPIAVLEALAYGIPCLLTPGTNMADEVEAAGAGWKVAPNPTAIAQGLQDALAARSELLTKGKMARNLVATKYSWNHIGEQLIREYLNLLC